MTYNEFGGTLNLAQSSQSRLTDMQWLFDCMSSETRNVRQSEVNPFSTWRLHVA